MKRFICVQGKPMLSRKKVKNITGRLIRDRLDEGRPETVLVAKLVDLLDLFPGEHRPPLDAGEPLRPEEIVNRLFSPTYSCRITFGRPQLLQVFNDKNTANCLNFGSPVQIFGHPNFPRHYLVQNTPA